MVKALPCRRTKGSGSLYSYEEVRPALQCDKRLVATPQRPRRILPESYNHVSLGNVDKSQAAFGDKARMFQSHASVALPFDVAAQILHGEPPRMSIRIKSRMPSDWGNWYIWSVKHLGMGWKANRDGLNCFNKWFAASHGFYMDFNNSNRKALYTLSKQAWDALSAGERCRWIYHAGLNPSCSALPISNLVIADSPEVDPAKVQKVEGCLFTYNGNWGLRDKQVLAWVAQGFTHQDLTDMMKDHLPYQVLHDRFHVCMLALGQITGLVHVSTALEHCHEGDQSHRVHLHCYMSAVKSNIVSVVKTHSERSNRVSTAMLSLQKFDNCPPVLNAYRINANELGTSSKVRMVKSQGHFYLQFLKHGTIRQSSNYVKNIDFAVRKKWIMNNVKVRKISLPNTIREIVASRDGVKTGVTEIQAIAIEEDRIAIQDEVAQVTATIARQLCHFIPLTANMLAWKRQYVYDPSISQTRFKTLVLDGPSRMGKTSWAKSIFGAKSTLVLDCQNCIQPNLRAFALDRKKWKAILFDEGSYELIHSNKLLFQAGPSPITLGQSPTQQHIYDVYVYGIPMIICSNNFYGSECPDHVREYLEANVHYESVLRRCWIE